MPALLSISWHFLSAGCPGPWARAVPPPPAPQLQDLTREAPDCQGHSSRCGCADARAMSVPHVHQRSARDTSDLVMSLGAPESRL